MSNPRPGKGVPRGPSVLKFHVVDIAEFCGWQPSGMRTWLRRHGLHLAHGPEGLRVLAAMLAERAPKAKEGVPQPSASCWRPRTAPSAPP